MRKERISLTNLLSKSPNIPSRSTSIENSKPYLYLYTFSEDVRNSIIPYQSKLTVQLSPQTPETEKAVIHIFSHYPQQTSYFDLKGVVESFVRDIAFDLIYRDTLYFELAEGYFENDKRKIVIPIPIKGKVFELGYYYVQRVLRIENERQKITNILIPSAKIWKVKFPNSLGGERKLKTFKNTLVRASELIPKDLKEKDWYKEKEIFAYISEFDLIRDNMLSHASAAWGWNARDRWKDRALEYYRLYRELKFVQTLALLRDHIIAEMNYFLSRTNIDAELSLTGLQTPDEIAELLLALRIGNISFKDMYNVILSR